jgi:hypothetical protein
MNSNEIDILAVMTLPSTFSRGLAGREPGQRHLRRPRVEEAFLLCSGPHGLALTACHDDEESKQNYGPTNHERTAD